MKTISQSPYTLDDPEKVHILGRELGGRRKNGVPCEVWSFEDRKSAWAFVDTIKALAFSRDCNSCVESLRNDGNEVILHYVD